MRLNFFSCLCVCIGPFSKNVAMKYMCIFFGLLMCQVHLLLKYPCHSQGKFNLCKDNCFHVVVHNLDTVIEHAQCFYTIMKHVNFGLLCQWFVYLRSPPSGRDMRYKRVAFLLVFNFCELVNMIFIVIMYKFRTVFKIWRWMCLVRII